MKKKEIRVRCWIYIDDIKFFGLGRAELLELIEESGSISKAAKTMGMSYKKAWNMIYELNKGGQKPYVISHKGGQLGGGAELTETGRKAVASYRKLMNKLERIVNKESDILKLM